MGAREAGAWQGSCEREAQRRGSRVPVAFGGSSEDRGGRDVSGSGVCVVLLPWRRLQPPPPPVLAAALVSRGGRFPREAEEGKRLIVPRDTKIPWAGVEL